MENNMFPISISGIDCASKENFSPSVGDGKFRMSLCNEDSRIKCTEDNTILNFDTSNLSQPESDSSKDMDLSKSFDFFLEGERLVSSLCGPKIEDENSRNTAKSDGSSGRLLENYDPDPEAREDYEPYDRFLNTLIPMTAGKSDSLFKNIISSTDKDSQSKIHTRNTTENLLVRRNVPVDKTDSQLNIPAFPSETGYPYSSIRDEFKAKHSRNWGLIRRSPISDLRRVDDGNHPGRKHEKSSPFKMNDIEIKLPFQYQMLKSNNKNDFPALSTDGNGGLHCSEADTKILTRSRDYALCFADNSKNTEKKSLEVVSCDQTENCDDEISFRKTAIEGCLVFDQIIRDFQLESNECDLESYCRNVKRCVSIANSLESDEVITIMMQMILCSLKLADSWSTLNSFFGNNSKHKPKSEDDSRLFRIFKQWQVCSKSILDCSLIVIQNLKSCIRKTEKPTNNISIKSTSEINPFKSIKNLQFNSDKFFFQSDPTGKENDSCSSKQQQGNLPENSRMSHFFNCIGSKQTSQLKENNDPSNLLLEIQQKAQSLTTTKKTSEEKKTKKKWLPCSLDNKKPNPVANRAPGQSISIAPQNRIEQPMSVFNNSIGTPQVNKSIFENVPIPAMNFMFNPFNTTIQNTTANTNSKDFTTIPQINFMYPPQSGMNFNSKPAVQDKDTNSILKSQEPTSQSGTIVNQTLGFNRNNMCNQQQMNFMSFQPNFNHQPFGFPNDQKNEIVYRTNFCFPDGKMMPLQSGGVPQPPTTPFFYPPFCSNATHQMDTFNNKYTHDKRQKTIVENSEADENSEGYYETKSYMKPGSYKVPNKNTFNTASPNDNLNYIFEDIVVSGITVPLTKTESLIQTKKSNSKTNVAAKKSPPSSGKSKAPESKDSTWRAAVASAEAIGKLVDNLKQQTSGESRAEAESGGSSEASSKASATESAICLSSEADSKRSDSPNKSE